METCGPACLHMETLHTNLELCRKFLKESYQKNTKLICSKDCYLQYRFSLGESGYVYHGNDGEYKAVHFTSGGMSYESFKTFADESIVSADDLKWTAFYFAVLAGDSEILRFLFQENVAWAFERNSKNQTCLHIVAINGKLDISKYLVDGYSFNLHDSEEKVWTSLLCTAYNGNHELFQYLLDKEKDPSKLTEEGDDCLHIASYCGHLRICELILFQKLLKRSSTAILNATNHYRNTCLHNAALAGHKKI